MAVEKVSVEEAGRRLGVSRSTVWRMLRRRDLPSIRERGRRWIPASALLTHRRVEDAHLQAFGPDHPIFRLVGIAHGGGQKPGAREKHALLGLPSKR